MAEAIPSSSGTSISSHENNVSMLLDKLKEFKMSAENRDNANIYGRVERKCAFLFLIIFLQYTHV